MGALVLHIHWPIIHHTGSSPSMGQYLLLYCCSADWIFNTCWSDLGWNIVNCKWTVSAPNFPNITVLHLPPPLDVLRWLFTITSFSTVISLHRYKSSLYSILEATWVLIYTRNSKILSAVDKFYNKSALLDTPIALVGVYKWSDMIHIANPSKLGMTCNYCCWNYKKEIL